MVIVDNDNYAEERQPLGRLNICILPAGGFWFAGKRAGILNGRPRQRYRPAWHHKTLWCHYRARQGNWTGHR